MRQRTFNIYRRDRMAPIIESPCYPVIERDDGLYQIGIADDAPGPFETRAFAAAVAARRTVEARQ